MSATKQYFLEASGSGGGLLSNEVFDKGDDKTTQIAVGVSVAVCAVLVSTGIVGVVIYRRKKEAQEEVNMEMVS